MPKSQNSFLRHQKKNDQTGSTKYLTHCVLGNFACFFLLSVDFFFKLTFSKKSFRNTIRVSNSLDPDQARGFVGPDLDPYCLQWLSTDDKSRH